jgi:hypothetical protein
MPRVAAVSLVQFSIRLGVVLELLVTTPPQWEREVAEFTALRNPRATFLVACAGMALLQVGQQWACSVKLTVGKAPPVCLSISRAETFLPDA